MLLPPKLAGKGRLLAAPCAARLLPNSDTRLPGASGACAAKLAPLTTPPEEMVGGGLPVCWPTVTWTMPVRFCRVALAVTATCEAGCCGTQVPAQVPSLRDMRSISLSPLRSEE